MRDGELKSGCVRPAFQKSFAVLLIIAVAMAGNLHLPLVQAVAWSRMYAHYRENYSTSVAWKITFSGEYPCSLCKAVQTAEKERHNLDGMQNQSERTILLPLPKLAALALDQPVAQTGQWLEMSIKLPVEIAQPETPPPRLA